MTDTKLILPFFLSTLLGFQVNAQLFDGRTLEAAQPEQLISKVTAGSVLILGESHGLAAHRDQHVHVLNWLRAKGLHVSVGLEFLNYTDQVVINSYRNNQLNRQQFLSQVNWQGIDFEFYEQQFQFPKIANGEHSIGLNIPRFITSKIAKTGLESLTTEERILLPSDFQMGRESYKKRFADIIHVPAGPILDRYFTAQSAWDDTMAWQASQFLNLHPEQVLVIIVGEFHAQYGGGLANRILARNPNIPVTVLSQVWAMTMDDKGNQQAMTPEEIENELRPSQNEGPRGDFIWVSKP